MGINYIKIINYCFSMFKLKIMVPDEDAVCLIDAPLPMELHEYRQFTYKRFTVNAHKCFSVCFTVSRNLRVME